MLECPFYLLQTSAEEGEEKKGKGKKKKRIIKRKRKKKTRHNRKQEQERKLAGSAEARCRLWLDSPSALWLVQAGGWLLVAEVFSSPSFFIKPLGLVCSSVAAAWWVAVIN